MKYPQAFSTTAIGSVPYEDPEAATLSLAGLDIPAFPQMVKLSPWEDMLFGALEGLPALIVDEKNFKVRAKRHGRENDLADFYDKFMAGERDFLKLPPQSRRGFEAFTKRAAEDPAYGPDFLKVQVIGPLTFGQMVLMEDEKNALVDDPELLEATALALGGKAAWEARQIRALGRTPIVFIDEPGLASFGSAFSSLTAETVVSTMSSAASVVREEGPCLIGCHVCGDTDWSMLMDSGIDIVNFDAYDIMELFSLYPSQLKAFLEKGGLVAWGLVPAQGFNHELRPQFLASHLLEGWEKLQAKGVPRELLAERAMLTTACGLGILPPDLALAATLMVSKVADEMLNMVK